MRRVVWGIFVAVFLVMTLSGPAKMVRKQASAKAETGEGSSASGATVSMSGVAFKPATLTVKPGTEVVFDNDDAAPHTVTGDSGPVESGVLDPGKAFKLVVTAPLSYHCAIHPSMKAKVVLEG